MVRRLAIIAVLILAGCGGAGNDQVASTPAPMPTSTPAVTTSLAKLVASQSFGNVAAGLTATIDATSGKTTAGTAAADQLTFSYDLPSNTYTVAVNGRSQSFAPSSQASAANGVGVYSVANGATTDRLTLEFASLSGYAAASPQYSGLGYWQHTVGSAASNAVNVDFFIFGLPSSAAQVPRTGQAAYATSVYGLVNVPGQDTRFIQGSGRMDVDFADGVFTTSASASETGIVDQSNYGTGATLSGSGTLSASANAFSGTVTYTGLAAKASGTLQGQFFGPKAQELGAAFSAAGSDGSSASGVIWGNQNGTLTPQTIALGTITGDQTFAAASVVTSVPAGGGSPTQASGAGSVEVNPGVAITVALPGLATQVLTGANQITTAPANFVGYQTGSGSSAVTVDFYKTGSANSEVALTYLTFGSWTGPAGTAANSPDATAWFAFGLPSTASAIAARSGSASYAGVAYGTAFAANGSGSAVSGKASFSVNFDLGGWTGSFTLKGAAADYGSFNATGTIAAGVAQAGGVTGTTAGSGSFAPTFYGPTGQEFGGPFHLAIPGQGTTIAGVIAAKGG